MTALPIDERAYVQELIASIIRACPARRSTSADERRAQDMLSEELEQLGLTTALYPFEFNDSLHENMMLHFGLGVLGTAVSGIAPAVGLALHAGSAASYWSDVSRGGYFLRRLLGFKKTNNLVAVLPARDPVRQRLVFVAHADAGFASWLLDPANLRRIEAGPALLRRPIELATKATAALAGFDALRMAFGPLTLPLRPLEWALTLPALTTFVLNAQVVLKNEVVPGANDNLSGCAALPVLARRLMPSVPPDVELVFVVTSCEEAHLGGADALAREMRGAWSAAHTVVIALDGLTHGDLHYVDTEGEVSPVHVTPWLRDLAQSVARERGMADGLPPINPPIGGSDSGPFRVHGYDSIAIVCVDPELGAPRHYHAPTDTAENLDMDQLMRSIDYAEAFARAVIARARRAP
jgi:acetylornithine deacetylase/succinyl-diaminopimelate desuccinylase-like protein